MLVLCISQKFYEHFISILGTDLIAWMMRNLDVEDHSEYNICPDECLFIKDDECYNVKTLIK